MRKTNLTPEELERILYLLRTPDISIAAIAVRTGRGASHINHINNKYKIRIYDKRHEKFTLNGEVIDQRIS